MGAALLVLGIATLTPFTAQAAPSDPDPGSDKPLAAPQDLGQDADVDDDLLAGSAGPGPAAAQASGTSPTSTGAAGSTTAPKPVKHSGPVSDDPALHPVDLGALTQAPDALSDLRAAAKATGSVRVVVTLDMAFAPLGTLGDNAADGQRATTLALSDDVTAIAAANGGKVAHTYRGNIPAVALIATPATLDALAASDAVAKIDPDGESAPTDATTVPLIGAADAQDRGFHGGGGTAVVVMDTGVEYGHAAFGGRVSNAACFSGNADCPNGQTTQFGGNSGVPCTFAGSCDHGTHVAGIAAGQTATIPGVADAAKIETIRVFHQGVCTGGVVCPLAYDSDILAGLNLAYDDRAIGTASVNISIGGGAFSSNCDATYSTIKTAIDNLRSVNIATVIAAGNDYNTNAVSFPGCISTAITVGATNSSDQVADFSNSNALVDVYAPGVSVQAAVPGGGYGFKSGTSMATPHVVGAFAVMRSAIPSMTVAQAEVWFSQTGRTVTDSKSGLTRQRINVLQAMGQELVTLGGDLVRDFRNPIPIDHRFATQSSVPYWSAVAIRPPAGADDDLFVYDEVNLTGLLGSSSASGDVIDFVVQDGNRRARPDWTYPVVHQYGGTGRYQVEYTNDGSTVGDSTYGITMNSPEIVEIRDTNETAGVPTYYRVVPSNGGQDPELYLMQSTAGTASSYVQGRGSAVAASNVNGAGVAEGFSHTSPVTQWNGLVLVNRSGSGGYTLYRDTTAPTGSVSIDGGAATTTDRDVDLTLNASDGATGIQDMRVSVDGTMDTESFEPYTAATSVQVPAGAGTKTVLVDYRNNAGMVTSASDTIDLIVATVPGAPVVTGSTPVTRGVSVAFSAPSDGGSPITSYSAQCASTDGGVNGAKVGPSSPVGVTGLTAGKSYRCRVRATNAQGAGAFGAYGATVVVPATAPGVPAVTGSTPAPGAVSVAFSAPASNGGSAITGYTAQCVSSDGGATRAVSGSASPLSVSGLTAAKTYRCRVRATNAVGAGAYSPYASAVVVPAATAPARPSVTSTTPAATAARVAFTLASDGGSPVTSYSVQCTSTNGGTARIKVGSSSPMSVTGLTAGRSYHCRARATNAVGSGAYGAYGATVVLP